MPDDPTLSWRRTFDDPGDPDDGTLIRARDGDEPEIIGRVMRHTGSMVADRREGWRWSLVCHLRPVGIEPAATATSGTEDSKRAACEALLAAWRIEAAWRETVQARPDFEGLSPYVRDFVTHGMPAPAKWRQG